MEQTLFIIKPEAFHLRKAIKKIIISNDLLIVEALVKRLTIEDLVAFGTVDALYRVDKDLFKAYIHFMRRGPVEFGVIEGVDVIKRFRALCGTDPDPVKCAENTLRRMFGKREPGFYHGTRFFLNAVHKSDNKGDALLEMEIFKNLSRL